MSETPKIAFLVPAYNVRPWPGALVDRMNAGFAELRSRFGLEPAVIFVDDGSVKPGTQLALHLPSLARLEAEVHGLRHLINRGQGAAIQTALEFARSPSLGAAYYVTFDSDGQHDALDVPNMLQILREGGYNIVFGNRFEAARRGNTGIPLARKLLLKAASAFERIVTGLDLADAHNGLRVFDAEAASRIDLVQDRMAHATEFKTLVSRSGLRYGEAPVTITYSEESLGAGQKNTDAIRILADLVRGWWLR